MPEKDNTKARIYRIAIALFKEKGFDNVTIRDICAASEVSKHTFYYYFESKDALLLGFHSMPENMEAAFLQDVLAADSHFEQYMFLTSRVTNFFLDMGPEISKRIISLNVNCKNDSLERIRKNKMRTLEIDILRKAQAAGEIRNSSNPDALISVCFGLLFSAIFHWCMGGGAYDLHDITRAALENALDVRDDLRTGTSAVIWMHPHADSATSAPSI